jgi:hypothetical protein
MLTFGLSPDSVGKPRFAGAEVEGALPPPVDAELIRGCPELGFSVGWGAPEPDPSAFAVSRGAGGGRGGLMAAALRSVKAGFDLAFVPARGSVTP